MPAEVITTAIFQTFYVGSTMANTVVDTSASHTVNVAGSLYYRLALMSGGNTGASEQQAKSLLAACESAFGVDWSWSITTDGFVKVTYAAVSGTGSITWDLVLKNLLGFTSNITSVAPGTVSTATRHPLFTFYAIAMAGSKGWQEIPGASAYEEFPDGTVQGWRDSTRRMQRRVDFRLHPKTWTVRTARSAAGTPLYPDATGRYLTPDETPSSSLTPPWSILDFKGTAAGHRLSGFFGTWQGLFTGGTTTFDECTMGTETIRAGLTTEPTTANVDSLYDWKNVVFNLVQPSRSF